MRKPSQPHTEGFPAWLLPFLFLTSMAVYLSTLNPALFRNDSPETITACVTLGVSHPPGYPLHTLLGRFFDLVTVGNPAMTLNLFSAFLSATGVCLFFLNAWRLLGRFSPTKSENPQTFSLLSACSVAALCFGFSRSYWSAALAAKGGIYNLQVDLELALFLFLQTQWSEGLDPKRTPARSSAFLFVFLLGLGFANHWPTQMLLLPALILAGFGSPRSESLKFFRWKTVWAALSLFLIPLSLYLYLPLRSHLYPALNFWAPFTVQRFFSSLFRLEYFRIETIASFLPSAMATMESKALYIFNRFGSEFGIPFALLSLRGILSLWLEKRKRTLLFLLILLATALTANLTYLQVQPVEYWHMDDHLLTVNWLTALLGAAGLYVLLHHLKRWGSALAILLPLLTFQGNFDFNDQKNEFLYGGYGLEALKSMDRGAFYFAETDYDYFSILYLTEVEHKRPDVGLTLTTFWNKDYWKDLMRRQYGTRFVGPHSIYCCFPNGSFMEECQKRKIPVPFNPKGTIVEAKTSASAKSKKPTLQPLDEFWDKYLEPKRRSQHPINRLLLKLCSYSYENMASYLKLRGELARGFEFDQRASNLNQSRTLWERIDQLEFSKNPDLDSSLSKK